MPPIIDIRDLKKTYETDGAPTHALRGVTLTIQSGEFLAIMGPSGSGKSTLLHMLGFLETPTSGEYLFEGKSFRDYDKDAVARLRNRRMGFVFQAFNLLARTSVLENVKLPLLYAGVKERDRDAIALGAIDAVGLSHRVGHEPSQLSGGEKQRVAIARALVNDPSVIFADEPTGNLDSRSGQAVMSIIQRLNEHHGRTIILITHETSTAEHAERIIRLKDGVIDSDERIDGRRRKAEDEYEK